MLRARFLAGARPKSELLFNRKQAAMIRPEGRGSLIETNSQMYRLADLYPGKWVACMSSGPYIRAPIQRQSRGRPHWCGSDALEMFARIEPLGETTKTYFGWIESPGYAKLFSFASQRVPTSKLTVCAVCLCTSSNSNLIQRHENFAFIK